MAKKRIIPKLQLMPSKFSSGRMALVTTVNFDKVIEIGDPTSQARIYEAQAVDELIFVDLSLYRGESYNKEIITKVIRKASEEIFLPITIGGNVTSINDFRLLLNNGADKIAINTAAIETPSFIAEAADRYGSQCVVVSIDFKVNAKGDYEVFSHGGVNPTGKHPVDWALEVQKLGAGEILLTSIERDGKRKGLEVGLIKEVSDNLSIPLIASGGCGLAKHFIEGFIAGGADAIAAGTFFCFQDQNPIQTRSHIKNAGINIRTHQ